MSKLYLIRHGDAISILVDPARPLSEKGKMDVAEMAAFMSLSKTKVDEIWHSTKLRTKQTAELIAAAVPHQKIIERQDLELNSPIENIAEEINTIQSEIMLVGHLPFLENLVSLLLTGSTDKQVIDFEQGGAVCLKKRTNGWVIAWMMLPEFISKCVEEG